MNITEISGQIAIKFYLKYYWSVGKARLGSMSNQIRTQISMATYSFHGVMIGTIVSLFFSTGFDRIIVMLAGINDIHKRFNSNFCHIQPPNMEQVVLVRQKPHILIMGKTASPHFIGCFR